VGCIVAGIVIERVVVWCLVGGGGCRSFGRRRSADDKKYLDSNGGVSRVVVSSLEAGHGWTTSERGCWE
jgi:hypothetical protein